MTIKHPFYYNHGRARYLLLAIIAGMLYLPVSAQRRNAEKRFDRQERNMPPGQARKQERQSDRWQNNRGNDNNGWASRQNNRGNSDNNSWRNRQPRQEQRGWRPAPTDRRPRNYGYANNNRNWRPARAYNVDHFRYQSNYRRPVYSRYNPSWRYSYLPRWNSVVASFSFPFSTITFGGYNYRYCDGVFYRPYNNAYRVCAAPVGIYINILPLGYRRIIVDDYPYYYYNGNYYEDYDDGYRVIAPPVGAIVESIPEGYETIVIDGETYYKVDDVQYKPIINDDGEIWYQVIKVG